jgi:hypothetical protein
MFCCWYQQPNKYRNSKLGVLRIDYQTDMESNNESISGLDIEYAVIQGLTLEKAQQSYIDDNIKKSIITAIKKLETKYVKGITGDSSFLIDYQKLIQEHTILPVFMTSLLQIPIACANIKPDEKIGIISANSESLTPNLKTLFKKIGINVNMEQIQVIGFQNVIGFDALAKNEIVDIGTVNDGIKHVIFKTLVDNYNIKSFIMEYNELQCYTDTIRLCSGLPVFDINTMINMFHACSI